MVLTTPTACIPSWIEEKSIGLFKQLRIKLKAVLNIRREIKIFKERKDPDDNYFAFTFKQAGKEASSQQKQQHVTHWKRPA